MSRVEPFRVDHELIDIKIKGEDVMLACLLEEGPLAGSHLYAIMDGHAGKACAEYIHAHIKAQLISRSHSIEKVPLDQFHTDALSNHAEGLQAALCDTFVSIHNDFCETGDLSGATLTVIVLSCHNRLMTICNVGDSEALVDTGVSMLEGTSSHRTHDMISEQVRLKRSGYTIAALGLHLAGPAREGEATIGPLRLWPGGLCPSRTIGDVDAGPGVVPVPHIRQILVPPQGCRLIMASDGLWDNCTHSKAILTSRNLTLKDAAQVLCFGLGSGHNARVRDDCSVIVVDILNPKETLGGRPKTFPQVVASLNAQTGLKPVKSGGLGATFMAYLKSAIVPTFSHSVEVPYSQTVSGGPGHLLPWFDVDCMDAYYPPDVVDSLVKNCIEIIATKKEKSRIKKSEIDRTTDGGVAGPVPMTEIRSLRRSDSALSTMTPAELCLSQEEEDQMHSPGKMATIRLKSVSHYQASPIDRDDLDATLTEPGSKSTPDSHVDVQEDRMEDEDESYDFSQETKKVAAAAAVEAALSHIQSHLMSNLAKALLSQRHLISLQILTKAIQKGRMGAFFVISNSDGRSVGTLEGDLQTRGSNAGDLDDRSTHCKATATPVCTFHQTVPSWLLPSEGLPERERLCPDILLVDQLPKLITQWDPDSIPTLLNSQPWHHKVVLIEVEHCQCGSSGSSDLFMDAEEGSRKKAHATLHAKISSRGLKVDRYQLHVGCDLCGETNQNLTRLLRDKMGVDALRASESTQKLHRHATRCTHRLLHHFQDWKVLIDPTTPEKRLASALPFFGAAMHQSNESGSAFPSPFSLPASLSDPNDDGSQPGSGGIKNQSQVHARRQVVHQSSGFLANPFLAMVRGQSPRDGVRLDEAPPEYPRVQHKPRHAKVKSWDSQDDEDEDKDGQGPQKALLEVDLSRESFLAVAGRG